MKGLIFLFFFSFCTSQTREIELDKRKIIEYYIQYVSKYSVVINGCGNTIIVRNNYNVGFVDSKIIFQYDDLFRKIHVKYTFDLLYINSIDKGDNAVVETKDNDQNEESSSLKIVSNSIRFSSKKNKIFTQYKFANGKKVTEKGNFVDLEIYPLDPINNEKFEEQEMVIAFKSLLNNLLIYNNSKKKHQ